jgi:hypothetical protein
VQPSPSASPLTPPGASLQRLARDLDRWGALFLDMARTREAPAVEQVLGGLVEWMGSDLLDGWLRLPIPLFEELSGLAEELLRACQAYLAWLRQVSRPVPAEDRQAHEDRIRSVLDRVDALAERGSGSAGAEGPRS